jgi:hypothetical protein
LKKGEEEEKKIKKFWEELIAYFPLKDTDCTENEKITGGTHIKTARRSQNHPKKNGGGER